MGIQPRRETERSNRVGVNHVAIADSAP